MTAPCDTSSEATASWSSSPSTTEECRTRFGCIRRAPCVTTRLKSWAAGTIYCAGVASKLTARARNRRWSSLGRSTQHTSTYLRRRAPGRPPCASLASSPALRGRTSGLSAGSARWSSSSWRPVPAARGARGGPAGLDAGGEPRAPYWLASVRQRSPTGRGYGGRLGGPGERCTFARSLQFRSPGRRIQRGRLRARRGGARNGQPGGGPESGRLSRLRPSDAAGGHPVFLRRSCAGAGRFGQWGQRR